MSKGKWIPLVIVGASLCLGIIYINFLQKETPEIPVTNTTEIQKTSPNNDNANNAPRLSTIAGNLEVPWALVFLSDGSMLITERIGRVRLIDEDNLLPNPIAVISDVKQIGEGGLLGIAIHPEFPKNGFVYLYYTYAGNENQTLNRVARFIFKKNKLVNQTIIVDAIPGAPNHNGGRIKFGLDKFLYITTGDAQNPSLSQNKNSLAGKILRVTDEGKPAPNNPFGNEILSYGHRNPQGITWDNQGRLWETEHGQSATDELNLINNGLNYGWPDIRGDQKEDGFEAPILHSGSDTWAPSGAAYLNGSIFFAGLRGQALYEAVINGTNVTLKVHLKGEIGRIREVILGPDNMLYITTSNRDGRGNPDSTDDKIIRVNPARL